MTKPTASSPDPLLVPADDDSGTPFALITLAWRAGRLHTLDRVNQAEVLVEFPYGHAAQAQIGHSRFVRLRNLDYALIA